MRDKESVYDVELSIQITWSLEEGRNEPKRLGDTGRNTDRMRLPHQHDGPRWYVTELSGHCDADGASREQRVKSESRTSSTTGLTSVCDERATTCCDNGEMSEILKRAPDRRALAQDRL
ncbi:hypothetical protein SSCG_03621 [Streptomyces clavuligerus]|nr:hypothetical protein [Streptomyces clavuligerus]EDY50474.1 hypothetical protein SSCG_03621 [Streptomyces clavuligerus]